MLALNHCGWSARQMGSLAPCRMSVGHVTAFAASMHSEPVSVFLEMAVHASMHPPHSFCMPSAP